ncbi:hypothetical protein BpHYR1_023282 [Brachionus plicatilis]|uniref:Uncharacterized protein n=1 Tax=Brachionus plicatilis TaxID=10195 RepID=A0A3M7P0S0_BRAPC|nr:hypothetical protein BpHYR1_023282 [Brachionus plicatilis]
MCLNLQSSPNCRIKSFEQDIPFLVSYFVLFSRTFKNIGK